MRVQHLDLSPYTSLTAQQASIIIGTFRWTLVSLNLSGHGWVGPKAVCSLRNIAPKLNRLVILGCEAIRTSDLDNIQPQLEGYEVIMHSGTQLRSLDLPQVDYAQFSCLIRTQYRNKFEPEIRGVSLPGTPALATILYGLRDLLWAPFRAVTESTFFLPACFAHYPPLDITQQGLPISQLAGEYVNGNTDGWIFILDQVASTYAFLHITEETYQSCGLRGFVNNVPGHLDEDVVHEIEDLLKKGLKLMKEEEVDKFMTGLNEEYVGRSKGGKKQRKY